jgi:putative FmdB family regulatory protein
MPLYEYECEACGQRFEVIQKYSDAPVETCTKCGSGPIRKLMSSPAIQFKGSGFYINDYAQKGRSGEKSGGGDSSGNSTSKSEDKKTDSSSSGDSAKSDTGSSTPSSTSSTPSTPSSTPSSSSSSSKD